jgi:hypothetical protein
MTNRISPIFWRELRRIAREIGKKTVRINAMYFKILRAKLGHIPARDFGNPEMKEFIKAWIAELPEQEKSRSYIQHLLIFTRAAIDEGMLV